ncbi:hypothetical protein NDU88_006020 [Pleurodeles waltl]|uniref:Uncharacterized protein n=1 Tax=Pleurodeles waltl TaxID=8319 RepID=A0AAV7UKP1_PLEWA|nr:hypothetical protein NDU88_006020 [Pleurodeles waltl]
MVQGGRRVRPDQMMTFPIQVQCDLRKGFQFAWCGPTAQPCTPAWAKAFIPHCRIHLRNTSECDGSQVFNVVGYQLHVVSHTGPRQARTATRSSSSAGSKRGHAAGCALGDRALSSTDWAHELPATLGTSDTCLSKGRPPGTPSQLSAGAAHRRGVSPSLLAGPLGSAMGPCSCLRLGLKRAVAAGLVVFNAWGQRDYRIILGRVRSSDSSDRTRCHLGHTPIGEEVSYEVQKIE